MEKCYSERIYVNNKMTDDHSSLKGEKIQNIEHK